MVSPEKSYFCSITYLGNVVASVDENVADRTSTGNIRGVRHINEDSDAILDDLAGLSSDNND